MNESVRGLAGPDVEVVGQVPDLSGVLGRIRLTVAPLRYGAGVKGKVLDSFAAGVPCVMSAVAAEGLELPAEVSHLVVDDEQRMASLIVRLLADDDACRALSNAAVTYIESRYSEDIVVSGLRSAISGEANAETSR